MAESILNTIKKMIGPSASYPEFNTDLIIHINSAIFTLYELGVGPEPCFSITGEDETWSDYLGDAKNLEAVKTYIFLKVKMVFDPPTVGGIISAYNEYIKELEFRLNVMVDPGPWPVSE